MKKLIVPFIVLASTLAFSGCKKWSAEHRDIYNYTLPAANPISADKPLSCSGSGSTIIAAKGTMLTGKTYSVEAGCDLVINPTDTLLMQPGVTLNMGANSSLIVLGTFVSNGSKLLPNFITAPGITKTDAPGQVAEAKDPAFSAVWKGIIGGPTCNLMVLRWTHLEFAGATEGDATSKIAGAGSGNQYTLLFANYKGNFIMEDSWLYGGNDDPMRISAGQVAIFRNTFEKAGFTGGDCVNVKGGTVGTMAYNMFIGTATNGQKASNKGQATGAPQTNVVMYNNTFVSGGYRQTQTGRGACIDYEEGAKGMYYNNLAVNCKFGFRVVGSPSADVAHLTYGYNYQYADSLAVANQFYPTGYISQPQSSDIPSIKTSSSYLPANYALGAVYDGSSVVRVGNPQFVNFPLPTSGHALRDYSAIGAYNFHILSTSPLVGKGYTNFQPLIVVPVDPIYGLSEATPPGTDLGCYQISGKGNQH
jgi:hypothetical protein